MKTQRNELDFTGQNIYVGFDVHLKNWTVTIMTENLTHKTFSQNPNPEELYKYLKKNFPGGNYHTAYEAGFCGYWIHNKLLSYGIKSIVVNPADIPTSNKDKVQKEDKRDSRKISKALRGGELTPIHVPSVKTLEDRGLLRTRATLVRDLAKYKNRIKSFLYFRGIEIPDAYCKSNGWSKAFINWLNTLDIDEASGKKTLMTLISESSRLRTSVLDLTRLIRELSRTEAYKEQETLLRSVPGIGLITAMTILTEIEDINRFKNYDSLCGFFGLVPSTNSSGEKEKTGKITPRGHSVLRSAIIESAWIAARLDPALFKCYNDYCKRMTPNRAIIRIAKKLVIRIKHVLKNKVPYELSVLKK